MCRWSGAGCRDRTPQPLSHSCLKGPKAAVWSWDRGAHLAMDDTKFADIYLKHSRLPASEHRTGVRTHHLYLRLATPGAPPDRGTTRLPHPGACAVCQAQGWLSPPVMALTSSPCLLPWTWAPSVFPMTGQCQPPPGNQSRLWTAAQEPEPWGTKVN